MVLDSDCWDETLLKTQGKLITSFLLYTHWHLAGKVVVSKAVSEQAQVIRRWNWKPFTADGAISRKR